MLLGFLGHGAGVEGPGNVLCDVNTKDTTMYSGEWSLCDLLQSTISCFVHIMHQVVDFAPVH